MAKAKFVRRQRLSIYRCPTHLWWAICVDDEGGGTRVTSGKCCGRWDEVKAFQLSSREWRELAELALAAAEQQEVAGDGARGDGRGARVYPD